MSLWTEPGKHFPQKKKKGIMPILTLVIHGCSDAKQREIIAGNCKPSQASFRKVSQCRRHQTVLRVTKSLGEQDADFVGPQVSASHPHVPPKDTV